MASIPYDFPQYRRADSDWIMFSADGLYHVAQPSSIHTLNPSACLDLTPTSSSLCCSTTLLLPPFDTHYHLLMIRLQKRSWMYIRESSNPSWNEELRVELIMEASIKTMKRKARTTLSRENLKSMIALPRRSRSKTPQLDQAHLARIPHYKKLKACGISASINRVSFGLKELAVEEVVIPFESGALKQR